MLAMLAFTACSSDNDERADAPRFYNVTLTASMGDAETRALSESGSNINASFTKGDIVEVVNASGNSVGTLTAQADGPSTTLSGTITGSINVNDVLSLYYLSATAKYNGQDGTLDGIAAHQHFAKGTITVSSTDPLTFTPSPVDFAPKQSITKFTFPVKVKNFHITAAGLVQSIVGDGEPTIGAVTGALTSPSTNVYVALRSNSNLKQAYSFTIQDEDGNWYTATKNAKLTDGRNYAVDIALTPMPALASTTEGAIGMLDGLPAIVVDFNGTKKAVALKNVGALYLEDYGEYYTFENRASGLTNSWYVPTQAELTSLKDTYESTWGAPYGVNGCTFTIKGNTLFLPAAGCYDNDPTPASSLSDVSTYGYYWSSTPSDNYSALAFRLLFYKDNPAINISVGGDAKVNAFPVRPFHALN